MKADGYGASYVLAQDPDADRFSAAEKRYTGPFASQGVKFVKLSMIDLMALGTFSRGMNWVLSSLEDVSRHMSRRDSL